MVIIIEGPRNVGKSFLLKKTNINVYKFPFVNYINESFKKQEHITPGVEKNINILPAIHYFSIGTDLSLLEVDKQLNKDNIYVDRGFLSSLVFGVQSGRITYDNALIEGQYILSNYNNFKIIYINRELEIEDNRNKDEYTIYKYDETHKIYHSLIYDLGLDNKITYFTNNFNNESINEFKTIIKNI